MAFTSPVERAVSNRLADEREALTQQLDFHRATLLRKLEGLEDEPLRRPMTASERARAVVAAGGLDDVVTTPWGVEVNLRAIMVHMVQETARHNGHADIIREAIDGATGH